MLKFAHQTMIDDPNDCRNVIVRGKCVLTQEDYQVSVPAIELAAWSRGGLAQDTLVSLTPAQRDFLITGISPDGWKKTFGEVPKVQEEDSSPLIEEEV